MPQFGLAEQEHHRRDHRPGPPDRPVRDLDLGAVGHADDDPIPRPYAKPHQPAGQPADRVEPLGRRDAAALVDERHLAAPPLVRRLDERAEMDLAGHRASRVRSGNWPPQSASPAAPPSMRLDG